MNGDYICNRAFSGVSNVHDDFLTLGFVIRIWLAVPASGWADAAVCVSLIPVSLSLTSGLVCIAAVNFSSAAAGPVERVKLSEVLCVWLTAE